MSISTRTYLQFIISYQMNLFPIGKAGKHRFKMNKFSNVLWSELWIWQQNSSSFFKNSDRKSLLQSRKLWLWKKDSTWSSVDLCLTLRQFCASLSLHQTSFSLNTIHFSSIYALTVLNKVRPQSLKMILWLNQGGYLFCPPLACLSAAALKSDNLQINRLVYWNSGMIE